MTSDFSGRRELHLTEVYGARHWSLEKDGSLLGVIGRRDPSLAWRDGENVARCAENTLTVSMMRLNHTMRLAQLRASLASLKMRGRPAAPWYERALAEMEEIEKSEPESERAECRLPFSACAHGFYAYFTRDEARKNAFAGPGDMEGVISATGRIDVGSKGFRAERAEICALHAPSVLQLNRPPEGRRARIFFWILSFFALFELLLGVFHLVTWDQPWLGPWFIFLAGWLCRGPQRLGLVTVMGFRQYARLRRMRKRYPSARVFSNLDKMYEAFPLSTELARPVDEETDVA